MGRSHRKLEAGIMKVPFGKWFRSSWRAKVARFGIIAVAIMSLSMQLSPMPVSAANDHVTTCANSGAGSLPAVVASAVAGDTVVFDQDCTGGNAIMLTVGTGPISITKNLSINATGHTVILDGGNAVRVFVIG